MATVRGFSPTGIVLRRRPVAASSTLTVLLVSAVTYTLDPSGETAIPSGSTPTWVENLMRPVRTSTPEAWAISSLETNSVAPSGLTATSSGSRPVGMVRMSLPWATSITPTASSWPRATYAVRPSGLNAMPRGRLPTVMVAVTAFERGEMTLIVLLTSFETQSCGSRAGASDALARQSGASNAARSGAVRSIIEDRLIGMNRPVEPADRVPAADVAQDCAQQVRSRQVRVRQVGAGQVGPHQQHFAEVCAQEVGAREIGAARVRAHDAHRLVAGVRAQVGVAERGASEPGMAHRRNDAGTCQVGVREIRVVRDDREQAGVAQDRVPHVHAIHHGGVELRAGEVRLRGDCVRERDGEELRLGEIGLHEPTARQIGALEVDPAQVEAREVLPAEVDRGLRRGGREGRDDLVAGEALLGGSGPRAGDPRGEARQRRRHPHAGHWLFLRSDSRCGRPGFNQPSLRAFTYWYSCFTAAVSSSTFHEGIPLSGRPFSTVYSKESRGYAIPAVLNTHRKSGAVAITGCAASSPWHRKQYTWNHFHP